MKPPVGKRRTREHVIADLSICFVEWQALRCGYTVERMHHDYGIDLELKTFNNAGEREPGDVLLQVKATDGLHLVGGQRAFSHRIQRSDLVAWLAEAMPVIVIVFDAKKTRAYWLYVQRYFHELREFNLFTAGNTIAVRIPIANRVNPKALRQFARFRDRLYDKKGGPFHA
jgi:hypothetical protein